MNSHTSVTAVKMDECGATCVTGAIPQYAGPSVGYLFFLALRVWLSRLTPSPTSAAWSAASGRLRTSSGPRSPPALRCSGSWRRRSPAWSALAAGRRLQDASVLGSDFPRAVMCVLTWVCFHFDFRGPQSWCPNISSTVYQRACKTFCLGEMHTHSTNQDF